MDSEKSKLYETIFETTTKPIFACDLYGAINAWNPAAADFLHYCENEITGCHITRVVHSELQPEFLYYVNKAMHAIRVDQLETILISKSNKNFW